MATYWASPCSQPWPGNQNLSLEFPNWRKEVVVFSGPELLKFQICRGQLICHQDKPLQRSENKTIPRMITGEAQVSGSCFVYLVPKPFLSLFIVSRILRWFPGFPPYGVQTVWSPCPPSVNVTCEHEGTLLLWLNYLVGQRWLEGHT